MKYRSFHNQNVKNNNLNILLFLNKKINQFFLDTHFLLLLIEHVFVNVFESSWFFQALFTQLTLLLISRPSHSFIGPALVVERHGPEGHSRSRPILEALDCHYIGSVAGQPKSSVALSACQGLVSTKQLSAFFLSRFLRSVLVIDGNELDRKSMTLGLIRVMSHLFE